MLTSLPRHARYLGAAAALAGVAGCGPAEARDSSPATEPTLEFATRRLADGVRVRYAVQGAPGGRAVILLHGYSDSWYSFSPVLPLLPSELRVYALDQRGHGESDRPRTGYALTDLAGDVIGLMDAEGISHAVIVGHSMGSLVAQQVARMAPARVERLVLVGSAPSFRSMPGAMDFAAAVHELTDPVSVEFIEEFQRSTIHRPLPDSFVARVIDESRKLPAYVWHGIVDGMVAAGPARELGTAKIPTLLLWGEKDAVFPREAQDSLLAMIPGAELEVYLETGHAVHWERPEEFVSDLMAFLRKPVALSDGVVRRAPL